MAAPFPRPECRLFRTYGAAGGADPRRLPGRTAAQWFRPKGRRFIFSSSSDNDTSGSGLSPSGSFDDLDDPDFLGSPVRRRRGRAGGRIAEEPSSPPVTPRRMRLRPRPPKCSTPTGPDGLPPFPINHPGSLSPGLSECRRPRDCSELGTSASLFSSAASPDPGCGSPAPGVSIITVTTPSTSLDAAADVPRVAAATVDLSSPLLSTLESRLDYQASGNLRSNLLDPTDLGNTADAKLGADGKTMRGSHCKRQPARKRLKSPGLSSTCKKRSRGPASCPKVDSHGAALRGREEASGRRNCVVPLESNRPRRNGARQKRKPQETMETSPHRQQLEQGYDVVNGSCTPGGLTYLHNACSWTKTRASFSFHKKKIVTAATEVYSGSTAASSLFNILLPEDFNSPDPNRSNSASWCSSSMHLLSPLKTLMTADQKASDAEKVYGECNQEGPVPFSYYLPKEKMKCCQKIGEGVFGEVFQVTVNHTPVALKIIAIEGPSLVNGAHQKTFEEILPEIIISKELSLLSDELVNRTEGFIGLNSVHCVQGSYPPLLLRAWDKYNSTKGSANDRPDFFEADQLFIVLEFEFGGTDLERMKNMLSSVATAKSILHQITASLAVAETSLHFEHRDLHWGNVLLKKTPLKELQYTLNGQTRSIPTRGLQANIIDYTLSRLEKDGIVIFCDVSKDEDLFTGEGDYQFEIYRLMRKENNNCWGEYHPYNNVLWLHYLTDKILNEMTYKTKSTNSTLKQIKRKIQHFHRTMLNFSSATELLCEHSLFQ